MAKKKTPAFSADLLDELLKDQDPATVLQSDGLLGELKKALAERMLNAELDTHLESAAEQAAGNHHNGKPIVVVISVISDFSGQALAPGIIYSADQRYIQGISFCYAAMPGYMLLKGCPSLCEKHYPIA